MIGATEDWATEHAAAENAAIRQYSHGKHGRHGEMQEGQGRDKNGGRVWEESVG